MLLLLLVLLLLLCSHDTLLHHSLSVANQSCLMLATASRQPKLHSVATSAASSRKPTTKPAKCTKPMQQPREGAGEQQKFTVPSELLAVAAAERILPSITCFCQSVFSSFAAASSTLYPQLMWCAAHTLSHARCSCYAARLAVHAPAKHLQRQSICSAIAAAAVNSSTAAATTALLLLLLLQIAIEGCCHGELDNIYATLAHLERVEGRKVDLLICCGDFQVRNSPFQVRRSLSQVRLIFSR